MKLTRQQLHYIVLLLEGNSVQQCEHESGLNSYQTCMLAYELHQQLDNVNDIITMETREADDRRIEAEKKKKQVSMRQVEFLYNNGSKLSSEEIVRGKDGKPNGKRRKGQSR